MVPIRKCEMIIYHHDDLDGRCAAAIMTQYAFNKGYSGVEYREVNYKDDIDVDSIEDGGTVAIVDFSFLPEVMAKVRNRALHVFWCDHHVTAKEYGYDDMLGFRDFSEKGLSGCECTWKFCFPISRIPESVKLIGDYDAWRLENTPACFEFYEGMKLNHNHPGSQLWKDLFGFEGRDTDFFVQKIIEQGKTAIKYRDAYCGNMAKSYGYETVIGGQRAFAMNVYRFGSQGFGEKFKEYPVCIAYIYDGKKFTVSIYSEKIDVSEIARANGGGGHKGAAGFVCQELPFVKL